MILFDLLFPPLLSCRSEKSNIKHLHLCFVSKRSITFICTRFRPLSWAIFISLLHICSSIPLPSCIVRSLLCPSFLFYFFPISHNPLHIFSFFSLSPFKNFLQFHIYSSSFVHFFPSFIFISFNPLQHFSSFLLSHFTSFLHFHPSLTSSFFSYSFLRNFDSHSSLSPTLSPSFTHFFPTVLSHGEERTGGRGRR